MGRLDEIKRERQKGAAYANRTKLSSAVVAIQEKKRSIRMKLLRLIIGIALIISFIYIPGLFMKNKSSMNEFVVTPDINMLAYGELSVKNNPDADFDNDGIPNLTEEQSNTNPWFYDTDMDGWSDYQEYNNNTNPRVKDNSFITEFFKITGVSLKSAYKFNDVVLWAADERSRVYGGVTKCINGGYYFNDFEGYAQFPVNKYAYKYENGKHSLLKKNKNGYWKIDGNMFVVTSDIAKDTTNQFVLFGNSSYIKSNKFTNFLAKILPDKGFIAMKTVIKEDIDINLKKEVLANKTTEFNSGMERLYKNDIDLEDLALLKKYIDEGYAVPVSLYNSKYGELLALITGYNDNGEFIIANTFNLEEIGTLIIYPISRNTIVDGQIGMNTYYQWEGVGFTSLNGDRISFLYSKFFE